MSGTLDFSLYDGTVRTISSSMQSLKSQLKKAEEKDNSGALLSARLAEDMKPLSFQVHAATRFSDLMLSTLVRSETTPYENDIQTYAHAHARIDKILDLINAQDWKTKVNEQGTSIEPTALPSAGTMDLAGWQFAFGVAIPNIYFHLNIAYAILRNNGIELSKSDYIMGFVNEFLMKKD